MIFAGITVSLLALFGGISLMLNGYLISGFLSILACIGVGTILKLFYSTNRVGIRRGSSVEYAQEGKEKKKKKSNFDLGCACDAVDCGCDLID